MTTNNTTTTKLDAYNEAANICRLYNNYKGDKRSITYKSLQNSVVELYMNRMNNFGKQLGLPTYRDIYSN